MGRIIGENIRNKLIIKDQFSGDLLTLYYRTPTAEERIAYRSAQFERDGSKVKMRLTEARREYGEKNVLGFEDGSFSQKIGEEIKPFSSNPASPNYDASWKDLLRQYASDVLEALAEHAFEGTVAIPAQETYTEKN